MRIEFLSRDVPASPRTVEHRAEVTQRLDDLGHIDAATGEINPTEKQWVALIGETEMPVLDWSVQKLDDGQIAVSLVAIVDGISAGDPDVVAKVQQQDEEQARSDERNRMVVDRLEFANRASHFVRLASPNDALGQQVAQNAEASA
jgi:hypothetical protein